MRSCTVVVRDQKETIRCLQKMPNLRSLRLNCWGMVVMVSIDSGDINVACPVQCDPTNFKSALQEVRSTMKARKTHARLAIRKGEDSLAWTEW